MLALTDFRKQRPVFMDPIKYEATQVEFYISLAYTMLSATRWGNTLDFGVSLFVAHFLALDELARQGGSNQVPGTVIGVLTGGTVDKVSYTRDASAILEDGAGHWGMTMYGLQYLRLVRMMGAGPIQIGVPNAAEQVAGQGAWPGPLLGPW